MYASEKAGRNAITTNICLVQRFKARLRESILSSLSLAAIASRSLDRETLNRLVRRSIPLSLPQHPPAICISLKEGSDLDPTDLVARSERDRLALSRVVRADNRRPGRKTFECYK